jgi:hypothetical protein
MPPSEPTERELADIAALADGSLPPARRRELEARLATSPELRALAEAQERAVRVVRAATVPAPQSLRERIEDQRRRGAPHARRTRAGLVTGLAAALGAVALLLVLALPGGTPGGPTVVQAAGLTARSPTKVPPAHSDRSRLISATVDGIAFPYWTDAFGWETSGVRNDRLGGRRATTVFYDRGGHRIGYTIVSGKALPVPPHVRAHVRKGATFNSFSHDGRLIVTWRRAGHTCVIAGDRVPLESLLALAAWR